MTNLVYAVNHGMLGIVQQLLLEPRHEPDDIGSISTEFGFGSKGPSREQLKRNADGTYSFDINASYHTFGSKLLHDAVGTVISRAKLPMIQLLLDNGADVNVTDVYGITPLMDASVRGDLDAVRLLLDNGANINAQNCDGDTALHFAASTTHCFHILQLLVARGAVIGIQNSDEKTAIDDSASTETTLFLTEELSRQQYDYICK